MTDGSIVNDENKRLLREMMSASKAAGVTNWHLWGPDLKTHFTSLEPCTELPTATSSASDPATLGKGSSDAFKMDEDVRKCVKEIERWDQDLKKGIHPLPPLPAMRPCYDNMPLSFQSGKSSKISPATVPLPSVHYANATFPPVTEVEEI